MRPEGPENRAARVEQRGSGGRRAPRTGDGGAGGGNRRQEWVPRGSAPPILNQPPPPPPAAEAEARVITDLAAYGQQRSRRNQWHRRHERAPPAAPNTRPSSATSPSPVLASAPSSLPQLVQELQEKLVKGAVECMICYDMVRRSAAIWSCGSCYSIFHLHCIKKWAKSPTSVDLSAAPGANAAPGLNWRCPGCQSVQVTPSKDLQYTCFCGRRRDPPNDLYLIPHSCGEPCGKPLDRGCPPATEEGGDNLRCPHMCVLQCHPGPCPRVRPSLPAGNVRAASRPSPGAAPTGRRRSLAGRSVASFSSAGATDAIESATPGLLPGSNSICSQVCGKLLPSCIHRCKETCHEGSCPPCLVLVNQSCRCGSVSRVVECFRTSSKEVFLCEKPCGKKKNCGRHRCNERCCRPFYPSSAAGQFSGDWDPHLCQMPCGKKLRCGQHSCQSLCHSGHCPACLETIFSELSCACGRTSIPPPQPCGTPYPSCPHPCQVPQPCGHEATHTCHYGDCPRHVVLRNIPCGSRDIRCNQLCGKTRRCGIHACARTCHPPPCDSTCESGRGGAAGSTAAASCGQVCGAPRRDCRHTCTAGCHPSSPCPDLRCEFSVTITCSCGRITATVPCGAGGNGAGGGFLEASIVEKLPVPLQPVEENGRRLPLGQRKLTCDEECAKLERKRVLADAFDIAPTNLDALHFGENPSVSELLSDLLRREPKWVLAVEERFKTLVLGKPVRTSSSSSSLKVHVFCAMAKEKRDAVRLMAERWKLAVHAAGWEPRRFLVVRDSRGQGRRSRGRRGPPPPFDPLVDMDPRLVVALLDLPRDADISALVLRFGGECELVWVNDKNALAVFADPVRAATAMRRLDHGSPYHGAVVFLQTGGASGAAGGGGGAWASSGAKDAVAAAMSRAPPNPWKKLVAPEVEVEGSWASQNRWNALDTDAAAEPQQQVRTDQAGAPPAPELMIPPPLALQPWRRWTTGRTSLIRSGGKDEQSTVIVPEILNLCFFCPFHSGLKIGEQRGNPCLSILNADDPPFPLSLHSLSLSRSSHKKDRSQMANKWS
ncbi:unnamed protein product [Spirodela intermedia]|uniref:Uncharacterized protein n=1 Tax=Spirodela intermedia TaxID=51605 RepID=A0A7I8INB1_SPIIN|nr:unnamed protein product [Spirodela intermedia]CAA6658638.1 unnamed protein product [Spirodela intermedia]